MHRLDFLFLSRRSAFRTGSLATFCALLFSLPSPASERREIQFNRDVRPILSDKCFQCHGPSEPREAELRVDTFAGATAGVIVPRKPWESSFVERIMAEDPGDIMPPPKSHKTLTKKEREILVKWIQNGAEYDAHWSLLPVQAQPGKTIDSLPGG